MTNFYNLNIFTLIFVYVKAHSIVFKRSVALQRTSSHHITDSPLAWTTGLLMYSIYIIQRLVSIGIMWFILLNDTQLGFSFKFSLVYMICSNRCTFNNGILACCRLWNTMIFTDALQHLHWSFVWNHFCTRIWSDVMSLLWPYCLCHPFLYVQGAHTKPCII